MNNFSKITDNYLQFSQYTDPGLYGEVFKKSLPNDVREIGLLVRKQLIHRMVLKNGNTGSNADLRYGDTTRVPWTRQPEDDVFVTTSAMLAELFRRDPRGLVPDRAAENKLVLTCRFTTILMASLLKLKGIPARVRSGFAPYFVVDGLPAGKSDDHWINQYWDEKESRWVTIDVDGSIEGYLKFDPYDMPEETFDFSADAWLAVRSGKTDGDHFWNGGGNGGLMAISWELFYDFHCLMNDEIIYHHAPEITNFGKFDKLSEKQLAEIDDLAKLMQKPDDNFDQLKNIWETKKEFRLVKGGLIG
ncbi:MAG: hypothetical protein UX65_C0002G0018 [Parcubacteria group bacterium GW2011_GWB1_46_8]|nr:MAG: hypothetical protein UX15_C0007G0010 [Parcubacteria group bacterium GW2011_GWA1_45_7]KKU46544.1 MAG: hypothetical protein UX65_C0002G0018 [Parcubacteria group bacterium GW2011_GWB1_46_8]KKU47989.1 MAG: hypothetical protein UX66_C0001G0008 [Parcubacteria group bacterium GW2011_GWF2_46_8]